MNGKEIIKIIKNSYTEPEIAELSLNEILRNTKISKGNFYHYFNSKSDLIYQILIANKLKIREFYQTVDKTLSSIEQIELITKNLFESISEIDPQKFAEHLTDTLKHNDPKQNYSEMEHSEFYDVYKKIVQAGIDRGELNPKVPIKDIINVLVNNSLGLIFIWGYSNGNIDIKKWGLKTHKTIASLLN